LSESGIKKKEQLASWLVKLFFALCRDFSFKIKMAESEGFDTSGLCPP